MRCPRTIRRGRSLVGHGGEGREARKLQRDELAVEIVPGGSVCVQAADAGCLRRNRRTRSRRELCDWARAGRRDRCHARRRRHKGRLQARPRRRADARRAQGGRRDRPLREIQRSRGRRHDASGPLRHAATRAAAEAAARAAGAAQAAASGRGQRGQAGVAQAGGFSGTLQAAPPRRGQPAQGGVAEARHVQKTLGTVLAAVGRGVAHQGDVVVAGLRPVLLDQLGRAVLRQGILERDADAVLQNHRAVRVALLHN
mmetsp:Transcript_75039/g.216926  ORF Transcript_75039/g.216926 Transcript_75039/m.216926 type:complete len:256 (-) Transcript_75039:399-1166(-)